MKKRFFTNDDEQELEDFLAAGADIETYVRRRTNQRLASQTPELIGNLVLGALELEIQDELTHTIATSQLLKVRQQQNELDLLVHDHAQLVAYAADSFDVQTQLRKLLDNLAAQKAGATVLVSDLFELLVRVADGNTEVDALQVIQPTKPKVTKK